jgi:hypothetical protein
MVHAVAARVKQVGLGQALEFENLTVFPLVGEGVDVRFESPEVTGGALTVDGSIVHLAAFTVRTRKPEGTRIYR